MKKIFSKFTKERVREFQIETAIYEDERQNHIVGKRPLFPEGRPHVDAMVKNYNNNKEFFVPCEWKDGEVLFPFVQGENYYDLLLDALQKNDKEGVMSVLADYKKLMTELYIQKTPFVSTEEFEAVFGTISAANDYESAKGVNIDLTLDNIILENGRPVIIDYEWVFPFSIPVKFPVYRALFALWVKHASVLSQIMNEDELYEYFEINSMDRVLFEKMNQNFLRYVEGGERSYHNSLKNYRKKSWDISELMEKQHYLQVFYNEGNGYSEEKSEMHFYSQNAQKVSISLNSECIKKCTEIRIDPMECASLIKFNRIEVETEEYIRKIPFEEMLTNGTVIENLVFFACEDPQLILQIPSDEKWQSLVIEMEAVSDNGQNVKLLKDAVEKKISSIQQSYEEQYAILLEQHQQEMAEFNEKERLLRDKLSYIEGTKAYKMALKKKVDSVGLWGDL